MLERLYPLRSRIETGSRVIKKRPIDMLDIDKQNAEDAVRVSMYDNNTAIVIDGITALFMGVAILKHLTDATLKNAYLNGDTKSQMITKLKNIIGRLEQS